MRAVIAALVLSAGCRDRAPVSDDQVEMGKAVEADDDFVQTRASAQVQARARLARINQRINELGNDASVAIRAQRDSLALQVEKIDEQGETAWDTFRGELDKSFVHLERQLDRD